MKITCPSCAAEYNVPDGLAAGRIVRCAKCATEWAPVAPPAVVFEPPPPAEPVPPPEVPPPPPTIDRLERPVVPPPAPATRRLPLLLAWAGSLLIVVMAVAAAIVFRAPISHAWPPSQRVYGALGLRTDASPDVHGDVVK